MAKFLVLEHQNGGCDYTIGCGFRVSVLTAKDKDAAIKKLFKDEEGDVTVQSLFQDDGHQGESWISIVRYFQGECGPGEVWLVEVKDMECLNGAIVREQARRNSIARAEEQAKKETDEKAELERLKRKYEK